MRAAGKRPVLAAKELSRTEAAVVAKTGVLKVLAAVKPQQPNSLNRTPVDAD